MQLRGVGLTVFISLCGPAFAQAQAIVTETEVQAALLALPPDLRPGAAVFSFASDGSRIQHRDGENGFAVRPTIRQELSCRCYVTTRRCCPLSRGDENSLAKRMASLSTNSSTA